MRARSTESATSTGLARLRLEEVEQRPIARIEIGAVLRRALERRPRLAAHPGHREAHLHGGARRLSAAASLQPRGRVIPVRVAQITGGRTHRARPRPGSRTWAAASSSAACPSRARRSPTTTRRTADDKGRPAGPFVGTRARREHDGAERRERDERMTVRRRAGPREARVGSCAGPPWSERGASRRARHRRSIVGRSSSCAPRRGAPRAPRTPRLRLESAPPDRAPRNARTTRRSRPAAPPRRAPSRARSRLGARRRGAPSGAAPPTRCRWPRANKASRSARRTRGARSTTRRSPAVTSPVSSALARGPSTRACRSARSSRCRRRG